jgi:Ni,Fe-hydrogenase III large subunit
VSNNIHDNTHGYRTTIEEALANGWRFAGLHATRNGMLVRALLVDGNCLTRLETLNTPEREAVSIVDITPAAAWDEREAADLYGVSFAGHEPLRPLVDHEAPLDAWTVPVNGHGPYQIAVGPIHAGVIESGHFRFHVVGDLILHLDAQLFYKHRGLERAAEGQTLERGAAYAARACAACSVANGVAYAHACEAALGLTPPPALARARTVLLELERTWNHLNDIAAVCAGTGLAPGNNHFAALTERARRLNHRLSGHRFLFGAISVGGSTLDLGPDDTRAARAELATIRRKAELGWRSLLDNLSFQDRLTDVGTLTLQTALQLGTVGPALRATGIHDDARAHSTRLAYDGFEPVVCDAASGDVRARLEQRMLELRQTIQLLEDLLDGAIRPAAAVNGGRERSIGVGRIESPRGATSCIIERSGNRIERLRLRTGSYANWPTVAAVAAGNLLPDFPLINKSFELCYACADR